VQRLRSRHATNAAVVTRVPNALVQESVRAYYAGWYKELVTVLPTVADGYVSPPEGLGLGTELLPGLHERPDACLRTSKLEGV
jgi:galactonate dehydratase